MDHVADRQNKELKDLSQLKDDFLSTVSHELRSLSNF
jgi:signal transduction histidine kinase